MTRATGGVLVEGYPYATAYSGSVLGAILVFSCSFGLTYSHIGEYEERLSDSRNRV